MVASRAALWVDMSVVLMVAWMGDIMAELMVAL
jgi:hypothetical protein